MRMIAINFGGLGDEVLFLPTLKSIKLHHPDWHITLLTEPRAASIKQLTNLVDEGITFDIKKRPLKPADYMNLVSLLRNGRYDLILSSGSSKQVSVLLALSGISRRIGYDSGPLSRMLLTKAVPLNREQYAGAMYHDLVKGLGINDEASDPEVVLMPDSLERVDQTLKELLPSIETTPGGTAPDPIRIVLHPGTSRLAIAKGIIKTWSPSNWCALIAELTGKGYDVVLAGGPEDDQVIQQITSGLSTSSSETPLAGRFINMHGKTRNVADLAALIQLSTLMICVDSAPMHIGVGIKKPLVALFGPTDPDKLIPKRPYFAVLKQSQTAPASTEGVSISVREVVKAVALLLSQEQTVY